MGKNSIPKDISKAWTLPPAFYRDNELFDKQRNILFPGSWQFTLDLRLLSEKGSIYPFNLLEGFLDEPLLFTKDESGNIHCLSNVCTHRGNLVAGKPGNQKKLLCSYHGRRFALDGKFEHMPEFDKAKNFPESCDDLPKVDHTNWRQFLFVSLDNNIPFADIERALNERVGFLPIEDFKFAPEKSHDYLVQAHWALYCDNYLEGFHIPFVHHDLNAVIDYNRYETVLYEFCNLQIGYSRDKTETFTLPDDHPDAGKKVAAYYFWMFPNLMLNFYPWGLSINVVKPLRKDLTKISFLTYVHDESKMENSAGALLDKVEREDEQVVENVQKGINSKLYKGGRFSPTQEKGVHHFHMLLSKYL